MMQSIQVFNQQNNVLTHHYYFFLCLVGIKEVVVGWRDDAGIVEQVETIPVSSLPRIGMDWKPNVCANFLLLFTSFVQKELLRDSEDQVFLVSFSSEL